MAVTITLNVTCIYYKISLSYIFYIFSLLSLFVVLEIVGAKCKVTSSDHGYIKT